ncbi:MAG TPA: heme NO-binding domain-containing protein [Candidatus Binatia bacterium]|nr:heme NO-binding domain-containing protein [Candidatus Binatia bacterium]
MRGEILNELVEFAADSIAPDAAAGLTSRDGASAAAGYEAGRRYELADLVHLADQIAAAAGEERGVVLARFGRHLFRYFATLYPAFLHDASSAVALLSSIDTYVHGELRKLYPDADFPGFACTPTGAGGLEMTYRSARPLADLAEGLILGCVDYFGDRVRVAREDLQGPPGTAARFVLTPEA